MSSPPSNSHTLAVAKEEEANLILVKSEDQNDFLAELDITQSQQVCSMSSRDFYPLKSFLMSFLRLILGRKTSEIRAKFLGRDQDMIEH